MKSVSPIFALLLLLWTAPAIAQDEREARQLFEQGAAAFEGGRFEAALASFRESYARSPRSELLYNIATTLDRLRRDREAIDAFRRYLEVVPETDARSEIEARIAQLERHAFWWRRQAPVEAAEPGVTGQAPEPTVEPPVEPTTLELLPTSAPESEPEPRPFLILGLASGGLAVASFLTTIGFHVAANDAYEDLGRACLPAGCTAEAVNGSSVSALDTATNAFLAASIAFAIASGTLLTLHFTRDGADASVALGPGTLRVSGRF